MVVGESEVGGKAECTVSPCQAIHSSGQVVDEGRKSVEKLLVTRSKPSCEISQGLSFAASPAGGQQAWWAVVHCS